MRDVLRLKKSEKIVVFDERGREYECVVEEISGQPNLRITRKLLSQNRPKEMQITVACALPKKASMDEIVDKLIQLGVHRIIPLNTARVVVKLDLEKSIAKMRRWQKIALNSSQQSQRRNLPIIEPLKSLTGILENDADQFDLKLIPTLVPKGRKPLKGILAKTKAKSVLVLIGPEGDFTPEEVALARKYGCIPVTLGDLVLRVDTACLAVVSYLRFAFL